MLLQKPLFRFVDAITRLVGFFMVLLLWLLVGAFFFYICWKGYWAINKYGIDSLFFNIDFQINEGKVSFWAPFGVTVFLAVLAVILTIPLALKCSIWISFYCSKKVRHVVTSFLLVLANIPSAILSIYVRNYLSTVVHNVLFLQTSLNLIVASISLVCMIFPLIILLFNAALETKTKNMISAELLGLDKNYVIYRIVVPKIKHTIVMAITFVMGRSFSESIMLSTILSSENYKRGYGNGVGGFVNSQLNSVSSLIGENFFSDGSSEDVQNLMFLFGGLLLLSSLVCNVMFLGWIKRDKNRSENNSKCFFLRKIKGNLMWFLWKPFSSVFSEWETGFKNIPQFIYESPIKNYKKVKNFIRRSFEYLCLLLILSYACTFVGSVVWQGIKAIFLDSIKVFPEGNDTLLRSINNTVFVVLFSLCISLPVAFFSSFFLSEYLPNKRFKKYTLSLINSASSAPSIIFGIFGFFIFIQTLGLTASGSRGKSLLSGILTMSLFVIPHLTHLFYTNMSGVHDAYREASYILGISKSKTFWKIIIPMSINNILFSVVLSIGKIIGETAPLYLTAGINSSPGSLFMHQGQTLTTRIYSQLQESNLAKSEKIIGETSFYCLLFIFLIVMLGRYSHKWFRFNRSVWSSLFRRSKYVAL